jgi:hypothetical protein
VTDEESRAQQRARRRAAMGGHREYAISRPPALPSPASELAHAVSQSGLGEVRPADAAEAWAHVRYARDLIEAM